MSACDTFRSRFQPGTEDAALLAHLRDCDRCLDFAAHTDPDVMFRAIGGVEMTPPGGVDAFVDDVMRQVRVREAETTVNDRRNVIAWPRRLAMAATIAAGVTGAMLFYSDRPAATQGPVPIARAVIHQTTFATKPVVEAYESETATIVEMPSEEAGDDVKIVMIFDENLPADL